MGFRRPVSSAFLGGGGDRRQIGVVKGGAGFKDIRKAEADEKTEALNKSVHALETILEAGLARDAHVAVGDWRPEPTVADLPVELQDLPRPDPADFAPQPLGVLERVVPGAVARHAEAAKAAETGYQAAVAEWETRRSRQAEALSVLAVEVHELNQRLEEIETRLKTGDPATVRWYIEWVLNKSPYPEALPRKIEVYFNVARGTIRVHLALPTLAQVVPAAQSYRYVKKQQEIVENERTAEGRAALYDSVVAQTALRTLYEVFSIHTGGRIDTVKLAIDEVVVDPGTGQDKVSRLANLSVDRSTFREIDLPRADPRPCFKRLKRLSRDAALSPPPGG